MKCPVVHNSTHFGPGEINATGVTYTTPVAVPNGTWDVKVVLGETPVHSDGSAYFTVPARTPVYFHALDEKNRVVQTMRSWSTLQPGEHFSCVGCHENRMESTPAIPVPEALKSPPRALEPFYGPARGFSFYKEIQPILNRKCVKCHDQNHSKQIDLRPTLQDVSNTAKLWYASYLRLVKYAKWVEASSVPTLVPPYFAGSVKSRLDTIIETGRMKPGMEQVVSLTKEEQDKIRCWIDLGVPMCGDYTEGMNASNKAIYDGYLSKRLAWEVQERVNIFDMITLTAKPSTPSFTVQPADCHTPEFGQASFPYLQCGSDRPSWAGDIDGAVSDTFVGEGCQEGGRCASVSVRACPRSGCR